jgi:hypothetical protein
MRTEHQTDLTLFCFTVKDFPPISADLENNFTLPPDVTTTEDFKTPDNFTAPFQFLERLDISYQVEQTYTLISLYVGFNAAWAVTCIILIGKWKERAVGASC